MKLNKRIIGIGLVAVAVVGLVACARGGRGGSAADSKVRAAIIILSLVLVLDFTMLFQNQLKIMRKLITLSSMT